VARSVSVTLIHRTKEAAGLQQPEFMKSDPKLCHNKAEREAAQEGGFFV
jgi:hypothetical protein